jgi:hypothetical protein
MSETDRQGFESTRLPRTRDVRLRPSLAPQLIVVVDTEEEFDWGAPFSRANTAVTAMQHVDRVQSIFDRHGIRPTYVMDYPVATQAEGAEPLKAILARGGCTIGAHLHPWVNPPFSESVNRRNSFTCNLPVDLQRAKLLQLTDAIEGQFGERPRVFKAGRYGLGRATVDLLDALEYDVDNSVCPRMDFRDEDGPSFEQFSAEPFFLTRRLMEIPCTVDYTGWSRGLGPSLHRLASTREGSRLRAVGVLSRLGAVNKVMLSPEGNTFEEMRDLTRSLFARGCRTFTFSFHSPSVAPGHTPYVRTPADLRSFLDRVDRFCAFFLGEFKGLATTPQAFRTSVADPVEFGS